MRGKNAGNRNQGSNWIWRGRRMKIYERDKWRCVWCRRSVVATVPISIAGDRLATLDHLKPRSRGGSNDTRNLVTACRKCNELRGDKPVKQWASPAVLERIKKLIAVPV